MEIAFDTKKLREICESESKAKKECGLPVAEILKRRLADLRAADTIADIVVGNLRAPVEGDGLTRIIDLCDGYAMIFQANHVKPPIVDTGALDGSRVNRIKILRIARLDAQQ